jgi:DNA-directed RNA polymerase specialized sigma24 family protein
MTALFPPEPRPDELESSWYVDRARQLRDRLSDELLPPLPEEGERQRPRLLRRDGGGPSPPGPDARADRPELPVEPAVEPDRFQEDGSPWPGWWRAEPEDIPALREGEPLPAELEETLRAALEALPPLRRTVLELRDVHGWSAAAVGRRLTITDRDQAIMLQRARSAVRRALVARGARTPFGGSEP